MEEKLTWRESYRAAYGFLDAIWQTVEETEQEALSELDTFLAGMMLLEDDTSVDPSLMELWHQANTAVAGGGGWADLSPSQAYEVMVLFLKRWAEENSDGTILGICEDLERTGPERQGWSESVEKVTEGEFDPYFGLLADEPENP